MLAIIIAPLFMPNQYPKAMVVTELNYETDTVTLVDASGFIWQMYGIDDWCIGDYAAIIMSDNNTKEIFDDKIIEARYAGFTNYGE